MCATLSNISPEDSGIALLAKASNRSIDDVAKLFINEMTKLEPNAKLKGFLPIFALRNIRELLTTTNAQKQ